MQRQQRLLVFCFASHRTHFRLSNRRPDCLGISRIGLVALHKGPDKRGVNQFDFMPPQSLVPLFASPPVRATACLNCNQSGFTLRKEFQQLMLTKLAVMNLAALMRHPIQGGFKNQLQQLMFSSDFSELYIMQELSVNLYR